VRPRGTLARVELRIGHGVDVHPFSDDPERPLVLGGVVVADGPGLAGHSDADAVIHACIDALLGAAGMGDIGMLFPDTDPAYAGADSTVLLRHALDQVGAGGWTVANIDCTVVLERPKLAPHRAEMERRLRELVGAPVSVKATRAEGLGAIGRAEGVVCTAVALIRRDEGQAR
jgi:2-C-methyl-D-erythritol 2,4-cyclodiphosphate synthase